MKLKTGPRVLLGLLALGGLIYGINSYMDSRPKAVPQQPPAEVVEATPTPIVTQAPPALAPIEQPAPQPEQPKARTQQDAALNALINGGQK